MSQNPKPNVEQLLSHTRWVRALAFSLVREDDVADDVTQEVVRVWLDRPPTDPSGVRGWLATVVRRTVWRRFRDERRRLHRERKGARAEALPSATELSEQLELQKQLADSVLALPEVYRKVILLRYYEGLSAAEIARRTGIADGTIRVQLKRGLAKLREQLDREHGGDRGVWRGALLAFLPSSGSRTAGGAGVPAPVAHGLAAPKLPAVGLVAKAVVPVLFGALALLLWTGSGGGEDASGRPARPRAHVAQAPEGPGSSETPESPMARSVSPVEGAAKALGVVEQARFDPWLVSDILSEGVHEVAIVGTLLDGDRRPLGDVLGVLHDSSAPGGAGERRVEFRSDARGDFRVTVDVEGRLLPPVVLQVKVPGWAELFHSFSLTSDTVQDLGELVLLPGGTVKGRVIDAAGDPVSGAEVCLEPELASFELSERKYGGPSRGGETCAPAVLETASDGTFAWDSVGEGVYRVAASSPSSLWSFSDGFTISGHETVEVLVTLESLPRTHSVTGIVLDPEGLPLPAAIVSLVADLEQVGWDRSDADGRFQIRADAPGPWTLVARGGRELPLNFVGGIAPGARDVEVRFRGPEDLAIGVVSEDGRLVPWYSLTCHVEELGSDHGRCADVVINGPGGTLLLPRPVAPFVFDVSADGFRDARFGPFDPLQLEDPLLLTLEPLARHQGRIECEGQAVEGVNVRLLRRAAAGEPGESPELGFSMKFEPHSSLDESGWSGADGTFHLVVHEPGDYYLAAGGSDWAVTTQGPYRLDPMTGVDLGSISVHKGGALEGTVLLSPGASASIWLADGLHTVLNQDVDDDDGFSFPHLAEGQWEVRVVVSPGLEDDEPTRQLESTRLIRRGRVSRCEFDLR